MSDKCRERFEASIHSSTSFRCDNQRDAVPLQLLYALWQAAWAASREEAAKELASAVPLFDESTPIYEVPVTYVDGGVMLPQKLAEDANAD